MKGLAKKAMAVVFRDRASAIYGSLYESLSKMLALLEVSFVFWPRKLRSNLTWRQKAGELSRSPNGLRLHLGCGDQHFKWMLNCDHRATKAADVVMDCGNLSRFRDNSVSLIFSHSFLEHLYRSQQIPLFKDCHRVLREDAPLVFLGIPDFEVIAESYLQHVPGIAGYGDLFDLFHVYRYTHGNPEIAPGYWLEQLHKSLFDKKYIVELLSQGGFRYATIFNYCYPGEKIPLCLGFVAYENVPEMELEEVLDPFRDLPTGRLGHLYVDIDGILN